MPPFWPAWPPPPRGQRHADRVRGVVERLRATADGEQAQVQRLLRERKARFTPFWAVNAVAAGGDRALLEALAARPEVAAIVPDRKLEVPAPSPAQRQGTVADIEWGVDRIGAPAVWSELGANGQGIVVAGLDTGVQFDHPALVRQYRGRQPDGTFSHGYNWFDSAPVLDGIVNACPERGVPCDEDGHGTHTMGTIAGDGGEGHHVGVAPGARWIAARGCANLTNPLPGEPLSACFESMLVAAGQWLLAPADVNGQNPRPELAPHIINNSWGGQGGSGWFGEITSRWREAGIFATFAAGNAGPDCRRIGSPGDYWNVYTAGASTPSDTIADFSSRGPSALDDAIKPDIAAPGDAVFSSYRGGRYATLSGTSMAAPHVAGAVALIWSAAPAYQGRVPETIAVLDDAARDGDAGSCGGTADDNNTWGEGRLDALAAARQARGGLLATVTGRVAGAAGAPIGGATVDFSGGPDSRQAITSADGRYELKVRAGRYTVDVRHFGHLPQHLPLDAAPDVTATVDATLTTAARRNVDGTVRDPYGHLVNGAVIRVKGQQYVHDATQDGGKFRLDSLPEGEHDISVTYQHLGANCVGTFRAWVPVGPQGTMDITLPWRSGGGYTCQETDGSFVSAREPLPAAGAGGLAEVRLPFAFPFQGKPRETVFVARDGWASFARPEGDIDRPAIPSRAEPNAVLAPHWTPNWTAPDTVATPAAILTGQSGKAPDRVFAIEWRDVKMTDRFGEHVLSFQAVLHEDGRIRFQYDGIDPKDAAEAGQNALIGVDGELGASGLLYAEGFAALSDNRAIVFRPDGQGPPETEPYLNPPSELYVPIGQDPELRTGVLVSNGTNPGGEVEVGYVDGTGATVASKRWPIANEGTTEPIIDQGPAGFSGGMRVRGLGDAGEPLVAVVANHIKGRAVASSNGFTRGADPGPGKRTVAPGASVTFLQRAEGTADDDPKFAGCTYVGSATITSYVGW